jgi:microcystin-dependent protein
MSSEIVGMIKLYTETFDPAQFRPCNGQSLAAAEFPSLYAVIGNTFGGDSANFNLPNLNASLPFPGGKTPVYIMCVHGTFPGAGTGQKDYLGVVKLYGGTPALTTFKHCNGQSLPVDNWQALYSIIGTTYGGSTTNFNLPNLNTPTPFPTAPAVKYVICVSGVYPPRP